METKTIEERRLSIEVWDCHLANAVTIIAATQGRVEGTNGISSVKKEPVYCYHKAGKTEWWRTVEVSSCVIVIFFSFFFFILVAWGVDLTYRYVIDKNIFFGKNLSSLWRWMLQIETRKNQLIFNWLLAV